MFYCIKFTEGVARYNVYVPNLINFDKIEVINFKKTGIFVSNNCNN